MLLATGTLGTAPDADKQGVASAPKSYLTFRLARQDLAMDAARVRGILPPGELVPMPGARAGLLGVATLKGQTVAVLDLCHKLGLPRASPAPKPKVVILEITLDDRQCMAGFMADGVCDVVVYRDRDLHNGVLRGLGRPRKLIDFNRLVKEGDLAGLWSFSP
jgi:chemotaxis signal transduction protein